MFACKTVSKWDKHMVQNNLRVCYKGNMVKLFMKKCVCGIVCVVSEQHINALVLSHLCHLIFIPIKPLFHISVLSLSCLSLLLFPLFMFLSVYSFFVFHSWSLSLWFLFTGSQYLSVSSNAVLLPPAFSTHKIHFTPFCTPLSLLKIMIIIPPKNEWLIHPLVGLLMPDSPMTGVYSLLKLEQKRGRALGKEALKQRWNNLYKGNEQEISRR